MILWEMINNFCEDCGESGKEGAEADRGVLLPNRWTKQTKEQTLVIEESILQLKIICRMLSRKKIILLFLNNQV